MSSGEAAVLADREVELEQSDPGSRRRAFLAVLRPWRRFVPLAAVIATCAGLLVTLRALLVQIPYLNDSAMAEEMVRFARFRISHGHFPPGSWFPFLNLGSPQYLHYQSLGAMLTALLAWPLGTGRAFTLVLWLLTGAWPLAVYWSARIMRLPAPAAAAAACLAPFLSSFTEVGYEQVGYTASGYGLFSQLFAMWALPIAWALCWRAVEEGRFVLLAALAVAATAAFHFETGYLAFLAAPVFALLRPSDIRRRAARAGAVVLGGGLLAAWAIVPLVADGKWAAINQFLQYGPSSVDAHSYGFGKVMSALFEGGVLDWHHFPVVTVLAACGLLAVIWPGRGPSSRGLAPGDRGRRLGVGLLVLLACCLVLFIGPNTIGLLLQVVPGGRDLFFRRFVIGVQLSSLLLAGIGAVALYELVADHARNLSALRRPESAERGRLAGGLLVVLLVLAGIGAGWSFATTKAAEDASLVSAQSNPTVRAEYAQLDALLRIIKANRGGRVFAGDPGDYGVNFRVGDVPVYKYLTTKNIDEVGFTLRTASLMSDPEVYFDQSNPADYLLYGIRWILYPAGENPPVPAQKVAQRGDFALYSLGTSRYLQLVQTRGTVAANSADLASFAESFQAGLPSVGAVYPDVSYEGGVPGVPTLLPGQPPYSSVGQIVSEWVDLPAGRATATLDVTRRCVLLLSASYDPGWVARIDGHRAKTEMIAPALVGLLVGPGRHRVSLTYEGYPDYPLLFGVGALGLVGLGVLERRRALAEPAQVAEGEEGEGHGEPDAHEPVEDDS